MDGIAELRQDHRSIEAGLRELGRTGPKATRQRKKLLKQVTEELAGHLDLEEQLLFPMVEQETDEKASILKAREYHEVVKSLLQQLGSMDLQEEAFQPKVEVLSDLFHAHLLEEQRAVYASLRSALTRRQLLDLGERVRQGREAVANPKDYLRAD
jgi:Hemerythrin HHE cation binding domain